MSKKAQSDSQEDKKAKEELRKIRLKEKIERERRKAQERAQLTLFRY
ncbi:MAG: hypothetical protein ACFFDU_05650 [Candidatus Thorarchaeota archaeon]